MYDLLEYLLGENDEKDRQKEKPYFIEVNSTPGLIGIDDALSVEGSVVEKILTKFKDRQYWKGNY